MEHNTEYLLWNIFELWYSKLSNGLQFDPHAMYILSILVPIGAGNNNNNNNNGEAAEGEAGSVYTFST